MNKLGDALREISLPDSSDARERAVAAVAVRREPGVRTRKSRRPTWVPEHALVYAVAGLLALTAFSFTPPGRAIAGGIGDLVGIGDEPTNPPAPDQRGVVIGTGDAVDGYTYEIDAETNGNSQQETCIQTDFPGADANVGAGNCLTGERELPLSQYAREPMLIQAPPAFEPDGELVMQGMVPLGSQVTISYTKTDETTGSADVHIADLNQDLADRIGVADRAAYFLSILPSGILAGPPGQPAELTPQSVCDSLRRIHYSVTAEDGSSIADENLAEAPQAEDSTYELLQYPPHGFSSSTQNDPHATWPSC